VAAGLTVLLLSNLPAVRAQSECRGDIDDDGVVTVMDADELLMLLFMDEQDIEPFTLLRADVNDDGLLSGADIAGLLAMEGAPCVPTPTPPATPTRTATDATPPTPTNTRTPTPTPTPPCAVQIGRFGATNGTLSETDCVRNISGQLRRTDVYTISGTPDSAIRVEVSAQEGLLPQVAVLDPGGQFEAVEAAPPIQFRVTTTRPYEILVASHPSSPVPLGSYALNLTSVPCPTPVALTLGSSRPFSIDGMECPEPAAPTTTAQQEPADIFTFTVTEVPKNISITMQQLSVSEDIFPVLALIGPDQFEMVSQDQNYDCTSPTGELLCAQIRFLALQTGTYTIITTGGGGKGRYSLTLASPTCPRKVLNDIPPDRPLNCQGTASGCTGALHGNTTQTACAAPLPPPGDAEEVPEPGSPADLYTFTASVGDVISVEMTSSDSPHVYVLGPAPTNALVAEDDTSGAARVAATLALAGSYTIVVANNNALLADEPQVDYTLLVQKCPVRGGLNPANGRSVSGTFNTLDCLGSDEIPYRTYAFSGSAGQFVTSTVTSTSFDALVRVFGPDGVVVENDDDLFGVGLSDARASRVLPMDGTYVVEVSASADGSGVDVTAFPPPAFVVRARSCATAAGLPGTIVGDWQDADCTVTEGRRADIYTFSGGTTPNVVTLAPPDNGCIAALLGNGLQLPEFGCSATPIDVPVVSNQTHAIMVVGAEPVTRGAYAAGFSRCPLSLMGYGDTRTASLSPSDCEDPSGARADWYLLQSVAGLVEFNFGMSGVLGGNVPLVGVLTDRTGTFSFAGTFTEDPGAMFRLGTNLAALLRVSGEGPGATGTYQLTMDPASRRL
jgi:hypothetical protein